jgi:hypothetical protein
VSAAPPEPQRGSRSWIGLGLLAILVLYTGAIHHGVGPAKYGPSARWYTPTHFLFEYDLSFALLEPPGLAFLSLGLPALLLLVGVLLWSRSALAAAIGVSCLLATLLFVFYGVIAPFPWQFFGAKGSLVLLLLASAIGFALTAPLLAGSWLRLGWPLRVLSYLPFVLFAIGFLRNATGTDESLPFAISPWPVVPVFGMEVGALFVTVGLVGTAIGVTGIAKSGDSRGRMALAVVVALLAPALLLLLGSGLRLFPFSVGPRLLVSVGLVCALAIALAATLGLRGRTGALAWRGRRIVVGALLLGIPLVAGQSWAYLDYYVTREFRAREIIDALQAHLERETLYPDSLEELVDAGDLAAVPVPSIGFGCLYDGEFEYQSFGTSYLMQFPAPRWVQCAYTPALVYEEYEDEEYPDGELGEEDLGESWSCPSTPPELW